MTASGVRVVTRPLRYVEEPVSLPDGTIRLVPLAREKGIDLRLALDVLRLARQGAFDCALLFSQDGDLAEGGPAVGRLGGWVWAPRLPLTSARRSGTRRRKYQRNTALQPGSAGSVISRATTLPPARV